jgi:hypothetical protein
MTTAQTSFLLDSTLNVGTVSSSGFIMAADVNGDGVPDLFATRGAALNRGQGRFHNVVPVGDIIADWQTAAADVNHDGFIDFVLPDFTLQTITFVTNNSGTLGAGPALNLSGLFPAPVRPTAISAGDVNGDGFVDLAVASRQPQGPLLALTNSGTGHFAALSIISNGIFGPLAVRLADINTDGRPDLIAGDLTGSVLVFTNGFGTNFGLSSVVSNFLGVAPSMSRAMGDVADVNGDGLPDLLVPSFSTNTSPAVNFLKVATNAGHGLFVPASTLLIGNLATNAPRGAIAIAADFNLDGRMDCVLQSEPDDRFVVATNRGNGTFALARTMVTGPQRLGLAVADFNRDGRPDVVSGDSSGLVQVYLNTSSPLAPELHITPSSAQSNVVYWVGVPGQFDLEFTTNVASTNWQSVTDGVPVTGVMLSNREPARFFRLKAN